MAFPNLFVFFFVFYALLLNFSDANNCPKSFPCSELGILEYPLTGLERPDCGLIGVACNTSVPMFKIGDKGPFYDVLDNISTNKYFVRDLSLRYNLARSSCFSFSSLPLYISPHISFVISPNLTLFTCDKPFYDRSVEEHFKDYKNHSKCVGFDVYYRNPEDGNRASGADLPFGCRSIQMPLWNRSLNWSDGLFKLLAYEFDLEWHVEQTKGASVAAVTVAASFVLVVFFRKKLLKSHAFQKTYAKNQVDIELFLKNHGTLAPKMYKYSYLKKITNSFSENLGKGGYGIVYKGKLEDGRLVAVKILSESKGNGEEFMNEVSSISRTSHVNVVALLGFCFDGSKRALIYEFMPNGSLEKFIPNTSSSALNSTLGVDKLFEIVVGIARGLEYLHQGCNTRILHFDIKPHNILLDKDFKPKISDFGLSKLCPNRSSIVLMQEARGTVGYIAPEVFCRNFGEVSHKSDVYSYGMMVLEMVVGRQQHSIDHQGERSTEIYFSDWIYKNLEQNTIEKCVVGSDISQEDEGNTVKRRLIIIGLWCIQTDPKNRPSIIGVIEMLEAKLESLQLPPKPNLSSSPRLPFVYSSSESKSLL
ncbi:LEAF RUST 10 DISEASE-RESISTANCEUS RECEPTOR-LIKE PROTEIN KINASE-like 2.1 isoform X3 [Primulina eburnea]|uniref:LEAF RUST 10 DISEASE-RESISTANCEUS RECEPTOR-LIKE PROTEIN KINASE-like 2.1 isoform X3 n=1 Tax=Primulina eburnea TaxID=1245227 RepID=UPI003C6C28CC